MLSLHFDVDLMPSLDGGLVADLELARPSSLYAAAPTLVPVISDTSSHVHFTPCNILHG